LSILPWILHFAWLTGKNKKAAWLGLSVTTAALIASHNLTAFMALPILFVLAMGWVVLHPQNWRSQIALILAGFATGFGLSAFYALPAFLMKDQTIIGEITSGYFDFRLHFLYIRQFFQVNWGFGGSTYGPDDDVSFHFGYLSLFLASLAGVNAGWQLLKTWTQRQNLQSWWQKNTTVWLILLTAVGTAVSLYLTIFKSQWLWEMIPLLSFIQFPWRFLSIANVLMAMLAGWGIWSIRPSILRWSLAWILTIFALFAQLRWQQPQAYLTRNDDFYYTDRQRIRTNMSDILADYLPLGFDRKLPVLEPAQRIVIEPASPNARWETNRPQELLYFVESPSGGTITWNIADFPGWKYYLNDQPVEPTKLPDGRRQLITPETVHSVGAQYQATPLQMASNSLSILTLILWLAVLLPKRQTKVEYVKK
jgi:hypothetical protein